MGAYEALLWRKLQQSRTSQSPSLAEQQSHPEQLTMPPGLEHWFQQGLLRAGPQQPTTTFTPDTLKQSGPDPDHPLVSKRLDPEEQHALLNSTCSILARREMTSEEAVARVKRRLAMLAVQEDPTAIDFEARALLLRRYVGNASADGNADPDTLETAKAFYLAHFACTSRDPTMSAELVKLHQKACYRLFDSLLSSSRTGARHGRICAAILAEAYMRPSDSKHLMKRLISSIVAEGRQAKWSRSEKQRRSEFIADTVDEFAKSVMSLIRDGKLLLRGRQKDRQLLEGVLSLLSWHFEATPSFLEFVELAQREGQWRERALEHSLRILLCQPSVGSVTHKDSLNLSGRFQAALRLFFDLTHPDQRSKQLHLIMLQAFGEAPLERSLATAEQDEDPHARVWASLISHHPCAINEMPTYEARFVSHALHGTPRRALLDLLAMGKLGVVRAKEGPDGLDLPDFEQLPAKLLEHAGSAFHAAALRSQSKPLGVT